MADKLPYLQFYPGDWLKDPGVRSLSFFDRGVWLDILCYMHQSERRGKLLLNGKAVSDKQLASMLGLDVQRTVNIKSRLISCGAAAIDPETKALMNKRMVRDDAIREQKIAAGKLGGNPILLKHDKSVLNHLLNQTSTTGPPQTHKAESDSPTGEHVSSNSLSTGETKARAKARDSQGSLAHERKKAGIHKTESEFMVQAEQIFGSATMEQWGGYWRELYRDNANKCWRVLFAVSEDMKSGKQIGNPGGYARDLWNRFAD